MGLKEKLQKFREERSEKKMQERELKGIEKQQYKETYDKYSKKYAKQVATQKAEEQAMARATRPSLPVSTMQKVGGFIQKTEKFAEGSASLFTKAASTSVSQRNRKVGGAGGKFIPPTSKKGSSSYKPAPEYFSNTRSPFEMQERRFVEVGDKRNTPSVLSANLEGAFFDKHPSAQGGMSGAFFGGNPAVSLKAPMKPVRAKKRAMM